MKRTVRGTPDRSGAVERTGSRRVVKGRRLEGGAAKVAGRADRASFEPAESVGYLITVASALTHAGADRRMAPHDLTAMQWRPLHVIATGRASTAIDCARILDVDAGSMTRMVDRLEAKGLIERVRDAADRRLVRLGLTEAGRTAAAVVPDELRALNEHLLDGFSETARERLRRSLKKIIANLRQEQK